jgi:hypothetical protein
MLPHDFLHGVLLLPEHPPFHFLAFLELLHLPVGEGGSWEFPQRQEQYYGCAKTGQKFSHETSTTRFVLSF